VILVVILLTLYCALLVAFHAGWQRAVRDRGNTNVPAYPMISVIVAVRNEQDHIASLMIDLRQQSYANYEVIIVNDHSTDNTLLVAEHNKFANVTVVQNRDAGKKAAIQTGVATAKGDIIATTDADCSVGKHWLECIQKSFASEKVKFAFGAVGIQPSTSFFASLQAVEFASLIGSGAASSALGFPTMSNGANLAFRKEVFENLNGYKGNEHIASGDDEFLMRKVVRAFPDGVKFIPYKDASVITASQRTVRAFVNQRLRWAGKWKHNTSTVSVVLAFFIFSLQLAVVAALVSLPFEINYSLIILLVAKFVLEGTLISSVCRFSKIPMSWTAFLALQILHPLYVIGIGLLSNFATPIWKDRAVRIESNGQSTKHKARPG
jgi:poly-beta-1,6-N-acetyl-D-glucosamine synthase